LLETANLLEIIVVLLAAVVFALAFSRLGLGTLLGYLVAGMVIGPAALGLVTQAGTISFLGELGVVFLLFAVGLEMPLERIRLLIGRSLALGAAQVVVTAALFAVAAIVAGQDATAALVVGAVIALSSTAIVLKLLADRGALTSQFGRTVFGVLVFQDLAVGPLLVCVLVLGQDQGAVAPALGLAVVKMVLAAVAIVLLGRVVLQRLFRRVAVVREPEIFAALTIAIVLLAGLAAHAAGLSMAFGAFLAGMLLAGTDWRHQVSAEIQPFRGLLLGLFFISVGMSVDVVAALDMAPQILAAALAILLGKSLITMLLARAFRLPVGQSVHLGIMLSQGGEFGFVLIGAALSVGILAADGGQLLVLAIVLTMMATPSLAILGQRLQRRIERTAAAPAEAIDDSAGPLNDHVVIAGYGRVGAAVARRLRAAGTAFVAIDLDAERVARARQQGLPVYYGDATRPELLAAAHVETAKTVVVALDDPGASLRLVAMLRYIFPTLQIHARARDQSHAQELERAGASLAVPELVATGLRIADAIAAGEANSGDAGH